MQNACDSAANHVADLLGSRCKILRVEKVTLLISDFNPFCLILLLDVFYDND